MYDLHSFTWLLTYARFVVNVIDQSLLSNLKHQAVLLFFFNSLLSSRKQLGSCPAFAYWQLGLQCNKEHAL